MRPRDKYSMFDRKEKGYRKGVHSEFFPLFNLCFVEGSWGEGRWMSERWFFRDVFFFGGGNWCDGWGEREFTMRGYGYGFFSFANEML